MIWLARCGGVLDVLKQLDLYATLATSLGAETPNNAHTRKEQGEQNLHDDGINTKMTTRTHSSPKPCKKQEVDEKKGCLELFGTSLTQEKSTSGSRTNLITFRGARMRVPMKARSSKRCGALGAIFSRPLASERH